MSDSNTLTVTHNAGFFSCCHVRLEKIIEFYNNYGHLPERIDGSKQFAYYKTDAMKERDTTSDYFLVKPVSEFLEVERNQAANISFFKKELKDAAQNAEIQFSNYKHIDFESISPLFRHYFSPTPQIMEVLNHLERKYRLNYSNLCTIYYRGTDKHLETNLASFEEFILKALQVKRLVPGIKFLLETDSPEFRNLFLSKFSDSIYFSEVENKNPFIHSIYLLASVIAMSKTKIVVCSSGNVSLWTALYRGSSNNIIQYLNPKEFIYGERNPNYDPNLTQFWV
jgi:hypothetical protein